MQPLTFITLSPDREAFKELSDALARGEGTRLLSDCATPAELLGAIPRLRPSAVLIVFGGGNSEQALALVKKISAEFPQTAVITAASDASVLLNSVRAGAREFLLLPVKAEELATVLGRTREFCAAESSRQSARKSGRVVGVFSNKGGSGVSFLAANLAASMPVPTILADLNLQAGDAESFLNLEAKLTIADMVKNRARLDDALVQSFITYHSGRLSLLAAPREAHEAEDIHPEDVTEVISHLRQRFDCVVLDLQHTFDPVTVAAMDEADDIVLVLTLDIPGIRSTKRALTVFDRVGYPRKKIRAVVNRWSKQVDVELQKVEAHLGERLIGFVPNDYRKVMESINLGEPLVQKEPASKISAEVRRIAALVMGGERTESSQPRKGFLKSLFNRQETPAELQFSSSLDGAG